MVREPTLKFYLDKECTQECKEDLTPDFGVVDTGESRILEIYIKNSARVPTVNIELQIDNPEVKILKAPTTLAVGESASVKLEWATNIEILEGLEGHAEGKGTRISGSYKELWK
jgi:hypothetical protein